MDMLLELSALRSEDLLEQLPPDLHAKLTVREDGCWAWAGEMNKNGYASLRKLHTRTLIHREAWRFFIPLNEGDVLDHLCRNRGCSNPRHMDLVTRQENTKRGQSPSALKAKQHYCKRGHPLVPGNLMPRKDGRRDCALCRKER